MSKQKSCSIWGLSSQARAERKKTGTGEHRLPSYLLGLLFGYFDLNVRLTLVYHKQVDVRTV
jgi:hypothetical protein